MILKHLNSPVFAGSLMSMTPKHKPPPHFTPQRGEVNVPCAVRGLLKDRPGTSTDLSVLVSVPGLSSKTSDDFRKSNKRIHHTLSRSHSTRG